MRSVRAWVASAALAASAVPAAADWQYTRWGMSPDQVEAASNGTARDNADRGLDAAGYKATLTAPYRGASLAFTAVFMFDDADQLQVVTLNPIGDSACPAIVQALDATYGKPQGKADLVHATTIRWNDLNNDNLVVYLGLDHGTCTIQYSRLRPTLPDGKGL